MRPKERMMRALNMEVPDRLPATVHQWQPYHLDHYMDGMRDLDAFRACGLDAALMFWPPFEEVATPQWRVGMQERINEKGETVRDWEIVTPKKVLHYSTTSNQMTTWIHSYPLHADEDIDLIRDFMPRARLRRRQLQEAYAQLGDDGIMRGTLPAFNWQGGVWQEAVEWYGLEYMLMAAMTKPDWVHAFLRILLNLRLDFIDLELKGASYDLIECGGGAGSDTCVSPRIFSEFLVPYDTLLHDALHAAGFKVVYHTCGGMMRILDLIGQIHCDASETLTPVAMGGNIENPDHVKQVLGKRMCLIGGLDQNNVLARQDEAGIRREVRRLFEAYGQGGGYIIAPCDHFFDVPRRNLEWFAQAAADCHYE